MKLSFLYTTFFLSFTLLLVSCGGSKPIATVTPKIDSTKKAENKTSLQFRYRLHFTAPVSMHSPHDEILIDTNGQMAFNTEQHMKNGTWKKPRGFAFLEPRDEDTLLSFIKQDILFSIEQSDVSPQCPDGDAFTLQIKRSDMAKELSLSTNTCAQDFNLLTGQQRKIFPAFIAFIQRLRTRYRPGFTD